MLETLLNAVLVGLSPPAHPRGLTVVRQETAKKAKRRHWSLTGLKLICFSVAGRRPGCGQILQELEVSGFSLLASASSVLLFCQSWYSVFGEPDQGARPARSEVV